MFTNPLPYTHIHKNAHTYTAHLKYKHYFEAWFWKLVLNFMYFDIKWLVLLIISFKQFNNETKQLNSWRTISHHHWIFLVLFFSKRILHFTLRQGKAMPELLHFFWATMPTLSWTSSRPPFCMLQFTIRGRRWFLQPSGTEGMLSSCPLSFRVFWVKDDSEPEKKQEEKIHFSYQSPF